jgi:hypothetical protein
VTRRPVTLLVAIVLVAMVAACGVRGESEPRDVAADDVPFGLLDADTTSTSSIPVEGSVPVKVFLVNSERHLVEVDRLAVSDDAIGAMRALLVPVSEEESAEGLTNNIPEGTTVLGVDPGNGPRTVVVNLSEEFNAIQGPVQVAAVAQIVWTLTALPDVGGVQFAFEGEIRPVPRGDGETTSDPLGRPSFSDLAPEE